MSETSEIAKPAILAILDVDLVVVESAAANTALKTLASTAVAIS